MVRSLARETEMNMDRQNALLTGEFTRWFSRKEVMADLFGLFQIYYKFGRYMNPLPGIRKCFPGLLWKHWTFDEWASETEKSQVTRFAETSDFVWRISEREFVTASSKERPRDGDLLYHVCFFGVSGLDHISREGLCVILSAL